MPNSRSRKKRLAEKQRRDNKQSMDRRLSTTSVNLQPVHNGGAGQRRMSVGCSSRIRSDSTSSDSCAEDMHDDQAGVVTSAYSWLSYGLDYVLPSRKLVRELEETKERLKEAETQLKKEKKKSRRSMTQSVSFAAGPFSTSPAPPPPCPVMAPPPPPPPPPPLELLLPKPIVIKIGKRSSSSSSANAASSSRPLVTIADLKNIKLKPAARMTTRSQARKDVSDGGPLVSLQQLQSVRLKRSRTLDPKSMKSTMQAASVGPFPKRLRRLDIKRSPGGTPLSLAAEHCANKENVDMTPILSMALKQRFSTAMPNSPLSEADESNSSFLSSDGFS